MINLIIALLFVIVASPSHAQGKEIRIGVSLSLSGKYAQMGLMQQKGFQLWQSLTNAHGGLLNKEVHLVIHDDESKAQKAKTLYTQMIEQDGVDLVFGPYSSTISKAILPVTERLKYPVLLSGASADSLWEQNYKYAYGVYTPASKYTVGFLQLLTRKRITDIAIISVDNAFSQSLSASTKSWAGKFRLNIVFFEELTSVHGFEEALTKAQAAGARAVIVCGHMKESVAVAKALRAINWQPEAYYASVGPATEDYHKILGEDANLAFSSSQWEPSVGTHFPRGKEFIDTFTKTYELKPTYHAATAFAAGMILQAAVDITGNIDREELKSTFSLMDTTTLIGRYGVDKSGWQMRHFPLIIQWQDGEKRVVWPEKLRNSAPIFQ